MRNGQKIDQRIQDEIVSMHQAGKEIWEISKQTDVSESTIRNYIDPSRREQINARARINARRASRVRCTCGGLRHKSATMCAECRGEFMKGKGPTISVLIEQMRESGKPLLPRDLAEITGINVDHIRKSLLNAHRSGVLKRSKRNAYSLATRSKHTSSDVGTHN